MYIVKLLLKEVLPVCILTNNILYCLFIVTFKIEGLSSPIFLWFFYGWIKHFCICSESSFPYCFLFYETVSSCPWPGWLVFLLIWGKSWFNHLSYSNLLVWILSSALFGIDCNGCWNWQRPVIWRQIGGVGSASDLRTLIF